MFETNTYVLRLRPRLLVVGIKVWDRDSSLWSQILRLIPRLWIGGLKAWDWDQLSLKTKMILSSFRFIKHVFASQVVLVLLLWSTKWSLTQEEKKFQLNCVKSLWKYDWQFYKLKVLWRVKPGVSKIIYEAVWLHTNL